MFMDGNIFENDVCQNVGHFVLAVMYQNKNQGVLVRSANLSIFESLVRNIGATCTMAAK